MKENPKILYISSADPTVGPGVIAMDHYNALKQNGAEVDFLTLRRVKNNTEIKYIYENKIPKWHNLRYRLYRRFGKYDKKGSYPFFYLKESHPPVPVKKVLKVIANDYDIIIVYFWQELLSYRSILEIYRHCKSTPKVGFICADYSPMTGGCHFFGDCKKYITGCGACPMICSNNSKDFTAWNNKYRQNVIRTIKPYIRVNSYMREFFEKSKVIQSGAKILTGYMIMDLNKFTPLPMHSCRKEYGLDPNKEFVILFGCQNLNDPRKGMGYMVKALNLLWDRLSEEERERILLVSMGNDSKELGESLRFKRKHIGYVKFDELPKIYSLANVFLSPSINDAGPSMVNQSIACGTPVVAFEMGSALDVVKDKGSGFTVPLKDYVAFSDAIEKIFRMDKISYSALRERSREVATNLQSYEAFSRMIKSLV